ncbi:C4-dicarboxylate ABC transporter [Nocardioides sp. C4-1]|uniref:SLAC1 family transporter n=1 Tax=Nocardioides sp. C4-1 TaxID=3151851 RepID=UPI003264130D
MTTTEAPPTARTAPYVHAGPHWFTTVMGTGIVANAATTLPLDLLGLALLARAVWVLAAVLLVAVVAATALQWHHHPDVARGHLDDPVLSQSYGAPAMALMTVGAGAVLLGGPVALAAPLWVAGTALGLWTAAAVPRRTLAHPGVGPDDAFGGWLMPVVPPMVSAATGPLLVPHLPDAWRAPLLALCTVLFVLALVASSVVIALVVRCGPGSTVRTPTLWIVLGPLGQSVTAAHTISAAAGVDAVGTAYGRPVWALAMAWLAVVVVLTARAVRDGLPFAMTWWAFTFPLGTVVTGTSALAATTGAHLFVVVAVALYGALVVAWTVVASRTALHAATWA